MKILVISYASFRQINRSVYRLLKIDYPDMYLVVPKYIFTSSGEKLHLEPAAEGDPVLLPMELKGKNPRTHFYPDLSFWLNHNRPDVVIIESDPVSRITISVSSWCKKNKRRLIAQTYENLRRDVISTLRAKGLKAVPTNLAIHLMNFFMAKRVNGLLVVNHDSEKIFREYGYKTELIPLGYDSDVFFPDSSSRDKYRNQLALNNEEILIAYFGRLVKQKGVHLLIEALSQIKSMKWKLLIDNQHDNENEYSAYIVELINRYQLTDRVRYFEADHIEIANYMRAADIAVAPSLTTATFKEQYGRAVQEAMACGCVPLVSDSGHLKDLVSMNSLVFPEGNVGRLSSLIAELATNERKRAETSVKMITRAQSLSTEVQKNGILELINFINPKIETVLPA